MENKSSVPSCPASACAALLINTARPETGSHAGTCCGEAPDSSVQGTGLLRKSDTFPRAWSTLLLPQAWVNHPRSGVTRGLGLPTRSLTPSCTRPHQSPP